MKRVPAFSHHYVELISRSWLRRGAPTQRAVIAGKLAGRTGAVELDSTDATDFIFWHVPCPRGYRVPLLDLDLHCQVCRECRTSTTYNSRVLARSGIEWSGCVRAKRVLPQDATAPKHVT